MTTLEKIKQRHAEELSEAIQNEAIQSEVLQALNLPDAKWSPHTAYADCFVQLGADTLPEAMTMAEKMSPLNTAKVKDGHLAFQPLDRLSPKNSDSAEVESVGPFTYHLGWQEEKELRFFVNAGQYIAEIRIRIKQDTLTRKDCKVTYDRNGNARKHYCRLINESGYFTHYAKWWASEETPNNFTLY